MKKISILSYSTTKNYGGLLQMFALQTILKNEGYQVEHINFKEPKTIQNNKVKRFISNVYSFFVKKLVFDRKRYKNELRFREELNFSDCSITSSNELSNYQTDCFIVGSDQVWNPYINGFDESYALAFQTNAGKVAYSASLGIDKNIPQKWMDVLTKSLAQFSYVSVREETAKNILSPHLKESVYVDLDPTLLLNSDSYVALAKKSAITIKEKFVLCYLMPGDSELTKQIVSYAKKYAHNRKLRLITIGLRDINRLNIFDKSKLFGCGPYEFIYLILNSEALFTNSFHGTAISILLNKKFFSFVNSKLNSSDYLGSRLTNLIDMLDLTSRCIDINKPNENVNYDQEIDYNSVNHILDKAKDESFKRLAQALK